MWLLVLLLVPLGLAAQRLARRRGRRYALRFPAVPTVVAAMGPGRIGAGTSRRAGAGVGRGAGALRWPARTSPTGCRSREASVVLVLDRSGSMDANDVQPTRLQRGRARRQHIHRPAAVRRAGGRGHILELARRGRRPTTDHVAARRAIGSQTADGATATGDALSVALNLLQQAVGRRARGGRVAVRRRRQRGAGSGHGRAQAAKRGDRDLHGRARNRERIAAEPRSVGAAGRGSARPAADAADRAHVPRPLVQRRGRRRPDSIYKGLGTQLGSKTEHDRHHGRVRRRWAGAAAGRRRSARCAGAVGCLAVASRRKFGSTESGAGRMAGEDAGSAAQRSCASLRGRCQTPSGAARMGPDLRWGALRCRRSTGWAAQCVPRGAQSS